MAKTLFYRLFGVGRIGEPLASQLRLEGLVLMDEGVKGSVTYINFRSPGRVSNWKRQWYAAAIALTNTRLLGLRVGTTIIDVPLTDERLKQMRFTVESPGTLLVSFDAGLFHADWSGQIEYRFKTPLAQSFVDKLGTNTK